MANRTLNRAQELAENFAAEAILLSDIPDYLHRADIVISSTASQLPILGKGAVESALKKRKLRLLPTDGATLQKIVDRSMNETTPEVIGQVRKLIFGGSS